MHCRGVRSRLSALVDGELSSAAAQEVECHVATCEPCERELVRLRQVQRLTALVPIEELPVGLHSRIMARLMYAGSAPVELPRRSVFQETARLVGMSFATAGLAGLVTTNLQARPHVASPGETLPTREGPSLREARTRTQPTETMAPLPTVHATTLSASGTGSVVEFHHLAGSPAQTPRPAAPAAVASDPAAAPRIVSSRRSVAVRPLPSPAAPALAETVPSPTRVSGATPDPDTGGTGTGSEPAAEGPVDPLALPGDPVLNAAIAADPSDPITVGGESEPGAMRMVAMPREESTSGSDDEALAPLKMFLEERSNSLPQPPLMGTARERRTRSSL